MSWVTGDTADIGDRGPFCLSKIPEGFGRTEIAQGFPEPALEGSLNPRWDLIADDARVGAGSVIASWTQ